MWPVAAMVTAWERDRRHPGKRGGRGAVLAALRRLPSEEGEQR
jgi:hypothetical protein